MIKTLLITSIVTAILAVFVLAFLVFNVVFSGHSDEQVKEFLNSPGVIEKFNSSAGNKTNRNESRSSPLVQQAEAFAFYLNPPKEKLSKNTTQSQNSKIFKPTLTPVSPKFTVLGTSYCQNNPEISQVLIDEPGKGRHWVRQSGKVGHLLIEQVKDGLVVVKGGEETFVLTIEKTQKGTSLPKEGLPISSAKGIKNAPKLNIPNLNKKVPLDLIETDDELTESENRKDEKDAKLEELVNKLKDLQSDDPNADTVDSEKAAKMEKLISKFRSSRVSAEEAKRLGNLGEKLKNVQEDPNRSLSIIKKLKKGQHKSKISTKI
jgi:hypothetical protein